MSDKAKDNLFWSCIYACAFLIGVLALKALATPSTPDVAEQKNTTEEYPLYRDDAVVQLPVMFTLNPTLVSDKTDMFGYCLTVTNRDVECYTMKGRFLGVGSVELYSNGNPSVIHVLDKAPAEYRQVMTNAFLRVWG